MCFLGFGGGGVSGFSFAVDAVAVFAEDERGRFERLVDAPDLAAGSRKVGREVDGGMLRRA
jgi:hypothetical protein